MATGNSAYKGLAVPLQGESQISQITAATDIFTITGASGQAGDFIVCENSAGTEKFVVDASGNVTAAGTLALSGVATLGDFPVINGTILTTAPSTGLTTGSFFWYDAANVRQLAVASGAGTLWRVAMTDN
jgi:uncharacterized Zn-binding protein involved in type VI secretion